MLSNGTFLIAVLIMAAAAFATRIAGAVLMSRVRTTRSTDLFLEGLSASVIAALVASLLAQSDLRTALAVAAAIAAMLVTRSVIWAMLAGMACAALISRLL
ncbi:AzlD domain-containing protein [Roseibium sp. SCP14]|uniref:AzlD domain-containing protein n=1 Tax=Roseibium sp. SCP14 TaxID=3141375 RepID=UPI00333A3EC3